MTTAEIYRRADGLWDWRLVNDENGQTVATSGGQGFTERNDAREAIDRIVAAIMGPYFQFADGD
jgi:uncharacterized protein YegP (UPF0339 family)